MNSNLMIGADYGAFEDDNWEDCQDCGGTGVLGDSCECEAFEDTCMCLNPTAPDCKTCEGNGGRAIDHSAEEQATYENENDSN